MELTSKVIQEELKVTAEKVNQWQQWFPKVKFDENGRCKVASISTLDASMVSRRLYRAYTDSLFVEAFNEYLAEKKYQSYKHKSGAYRTNFTDAEDISEQDFIDNYFHVTNKEGKKVKIKMSKILAGVQEIWLKKVPRYNEICKEIKELRKEGENFGTSSRLADLNYAKEELERNNLYFLYQKLQNEYNGSNDIYLSVNPLDLITSSGEARENPTNFSSCWSLEIYKNDDKWYVNDDGCYSNPYTTLAVGRILNRGILYIENGRKLSVDGFEFIGYKERSHVWIDEINGQHKLYIERIYPCKEDSRRTAWIYALEEAKFDIVNDKEFAEEQKFNIQDNENLNRFVDVTARNRDLFLDRVAIDREDGNTLKYLTKNRTEYSYENGSDIPERYSGTSCSHCGNTYNEEDMTYVDNVGYVCSDCFSDNYFICERCGEIHDDDDMRTVDGDKYWCSSCASNYAYYCNDCETHSTDCTHTARDRYNDEIEVCDSCLENYCYCEKCEEYHYDSTTYVESEEIHVCDECLESYFTKCEMCGDYVRNSDIEEHTDGNSYCELCYQSVQEEEEQEEEVV